MDKVGRAGFNGRTEGSFIPESLKPDHVLFLPKPGQLTFGVVPCGLFGGGHGCLQGYLSLQKLHRLKVSERLEGLAAWRKALRQYGPDLVHQSAGEHAVDTLFNSLVELGPRRIEPYLQQSEPLQYFSGGLEMSREGSGSQKKDLQGPYDLGPVPGRDAPGRVRIHSRQQAVEVAVPLSPRLLLKSLPQGLTPGGAVEEAVEQGTQVEPRAPPHQGQIPALDDSRQNPSTQSHVLSGREHLVRVEKIDQMVRDAGLFGLENFGGADIQKPVDLDRIATDDLALESTGQAKCQTGLSTCGRSQDGDEG